MQADQRRSLASQLRGCTASRSLTDGMALHAQVAAATGGRDTLLGNLLVEMYASCGCIREAHHVFASLRWRNFHSWALLLAAFAQNGHLSLARKTFGFMPLLDVVASTVVLVAHAQAGLLQEAKALFDSMPQRTVVSWNAMLTAYARTGQCVELRHIFGRMPGWGDVSYNAFLHGCVRSSELVQASIVLSSMPAAAQGVVTGNIMLVCSSDQGLGPAWGVFQRMRQRDHLSWNSLLAACTNEEHEGSLTTKSVFQRMPCHGLVACTTMVRACAQRDLLDDAKSVFDAMARHDHIAWNVLLAAYAQKGHIRRARNLLDAMPQWSSSSCNTMLQAYGQASQLEEAVSLFGSMEQQDEVSSTAMIVAYGHAGQPDEAWHLFSRHSCKDAKAWCSMLNAYAQNEQVEVAKLVLSKMPQWSIAACTSMLVGLAQCGLLAEAESVFAGMAEQDHVSWTAMVTAYAHNGHASAALGLFKLMDLHGWRADKVTYVSVVQACSSLAVAGLDDGRRLHNLIDEDGDYRLEASVGAALMHMYGKCGLLLEASKILDSLPPRERLDARPWTAMMIANSQNGRPHEAVDLFRHLTLEGLQLRRITLVSVLCACSHGGLLQQGWHYLACTQVDYGLDVSLEHYLCMLGLLGRAGQLNEAEELVNSMPFEPDVTSWTILLAACNCLGDELRGARVAERLFLLEPENVPARLLLASTYATAAGSSCSKLDSLLTQKLHTELRV